MTGAGSQERRHAARSVAGLRRSAAAAAQNASRPRPATLLWGPTFRQGGDTAMSGLGFRDMIAAAEATVRSVSVDETVAMRGQADVVLVDVRDPRELEREGLIPGAKHAPRGMLEFWIDPESPYHKPFFAEDKLFVFYCAAGWRSLLAAQTAQQMGLRAASLRGGFGEWKASGQPVEAREHRPAKG